jgi:hypothetical protein
MAASIVIAFSLLTLALGLLGLVAPDRLVPLVARFATPPGLWAAGALRLVVGVALLLAADASRAPLYLQIFGAVAIVAALSIPFIGLHRIEAMIQWWTARPPALLRVWSVAALAVGASFLWALAP